jgi:hypothetical protein
MTTKLTAIGLRAIAQALQLADATPGAFENTPTVMPDPVVRQTDAAPPPDAALTAQIAMTGEPAASAFG